MAKRGKTEGVREREARQKAEVDAAEREAETAARAVTEAAEAEGPAAEPPKAGSGRKRAAIAAKAEPGAKRARYARERKDAVPDVGPPPAAARSTTPAGRALSKNVQAAPRAGEADGPNRGPARPRAKP